jgi:flagellar biogenesis protein FliO
MVTEYLGAFTSLMFILGLLGLFAWGVKRFGLLPGQGRIKFGEKQLDILESKMVDGRNRLVVVSWRGKQFLLGTNPGGIRVIASDTEDSTDKFKQLVSDNENS